MRMDQMDKTIAGAIVGSLAKEPSLSDRNHGVTFGDLGLSLEGSATDGGTITRKAFEAALEKVGRRRVAKKS